MLLVLRLAWRNLWRQPRRTWLTTGAMIFSNVLLVFMISLQFGMYDVMIDNALQTFTGHLQVQAPGYKDEQKMRQVVPDAQQLAAELRGSLDTERVAARGTAFALASSEERSYGVAIIGVEPEFEPRVSTLPGLVGSGRFLLPGDAATIVVGSALARNLRVAVGDELTLLGSGLDGSFAAAVVTVVGTFSTGVQDIDRGFAEVPLRFFQDTFSMSGGGHQVVINTNDVDRVADTEQMLRSLLADRPDLVVQDWDALQPGLRQAIRADMSSAFFTYSILVILVAFSVLNTQLMSVLERTREFGIVMALGLRPWRLGRLVLLETTLMGGLGLLLGVLLGALVTGWFMTHGFSIPGMAEMAAKFNLPSRVYPQVTARSLLLGPVVVFVVTLLAALYPAQRLQRLRPVEALRST